MSYFGHQKKTLLPASYYLIALLGALLLIIPSLAASSALAKTTRPPLVQGPHIGYGINVNLWLDDDPRTDTTFLRNLGVGYIRQQFAWSAIEPKRNVYDFTAADAVVYNAALRGLRLLVRVDTAPKWAATASGQGIIDAPPRNLADFTSFMKTLVSHYNKGLLKGWIIGYEIWNEPNLWYEWGGKGKVNARQYVALLQAAYQTVKAVNPRVAVLSAGLTPTSENDNLAVPDTTYLQQMYAAGAAAYFDVLSIHAAGYQHAPEAALGSDPKFQDHARYFRRSEELYAVMAKNGDARKQAWITEFGWTTDTHNPAYSYYRVTEQQKASYIIGAYQFAQKNWPWAGILFLWNFNFSVHAAPTDQKSYWSILNRDRTPRPSYCALQKFLKRPRTKGC